MVKVRKAVAEDYEAVLPLLRRLSTGHDWSPLFRKAWKSGEETFGYILEDEEHIVGFLGLVHSEREINGAMVPFCGTSSWIVEEPYRMHSLGLLAPVIKMRDRQVVDLSASKDVHAISLKLGFAMLDSALVIMPAVPSWGGFVAGMQMRIVSGADNVAPLLNKSDRQILEDHRNTPCRHLLLQRGEVSCYIVGTRVVKRGLPFFRIHYFSNVDMFTQGFGALRLRLCASTRTIALMTDKRFLKGATVPFSRERLLPWQRMYKGTFVAPEHIDNLYSEYAIMEM